MKTHALILSLGLVTLGCTGDGVNTSRVKDAPNATVNINAATSSAIDPARLEQVARDFQGWGRVDDWNHWSPELCSRQPGDARVSTSENESTHGGNLYFLYAKDRKAYVKGIDAPQPEGQVIVKQTFKAREISPAETRNASGTLTKGLDDFHPASKDGKLYGPGEPVGLFLMVKGNATDSGTDRGWLYATTSMDGKTLYTNGLVSACMQCHADAPHDRLFGLQDVKPVSVKSK